jgi:hypothetical protein
MIKNQKIHFIILVFFLLTVSGFFYWSEYRPSKIKQNCSWKEIYEEAVPARAARPKYTELIGAPFLKILMLMKLFQPSLLCLQKIIG